MDPCLRLRVADVDLLDSTPVLDIKRHLPYFCRMTLCTPTSVRMLPLVSLITCAVFGACASGRETPPVGGPPDSTAPRIVATLPASGTLNFSGSQVEIEFTEYIEERGIADAVVITPIPARTPEMDWSGRRLVIEFPGGLLPDRTYAITLGAAVRDLAGNRLGQPFTLRISTGPTIDSGVIAGRVGGVNRRRAYVFAWQVPEGATTFLDTLRPDRTRPDFIAPVGDDGRFSFETLPAGGFQLAVVADEFGDQLITPGTDAVGIGGVYQLASNSERISGASLRLPPAAEDITAPLLYSARSLSRSLTEIRFSEPIDTATIRAEGFTIATGTSTATIAAAWRSPSNRLAVIVSHSELVPEIEATATARGLRDTAGNLLPDSGSTATFTASEVRDTLPPALLPLSIDSVRAYVWPDTIILAFDEAITLTQAGRQAPAPGTSGVVVIRDTSAAQIRFAVDRVNPATLRAVPTDSLAGFTRGFLEIDLRRVADLAGNRHDSVARIPVTVAPLRQSGSIGGTVADSAAPQAGHVVIVEQVRAGRTYRIVLTEGTWELPEVPEGEYRVSAFRDENGNGRYDYGYISPFRPAEAFVEWPGTVRVRPRWATTKVQLVFGR